MNQTSNMETNSSHYPSLRARLAAVLIILAALFAVGLSSVLYINFREELRSSLRHRLENITSLAGLQQNGDELLRVEAAGDEHFVKIHEQNVRIKRSDPELRFVYTMRKDEQGIYFVVDARLSPDEPLISEYGDRYEKPSDTLVENFDSMTETIIEPDFYTDEFGTFLSGYTPIFTSDGRRVGVLGVDISASTILAQEQKYLVRLVIILLGALLLLVIAGVISATYLAGPIIGIRDAARRISKGELTFRITKIPHTRELAELAADLNTMTANLGELINALEQRVAERTSEISRKADHLRAASYIARQTAEVRDLSSLLNTVVKLLTDQFGFYHTGIFLINDTGAEVVLQAASSEGGRRMLERGHSLSVGTQGIVGHVAAQKKPRIALDIGLDAVFFNNPDLPMTRSEIALPLLVRNKVLGILDIQSDKPQAFNQEDIDVLETVADQVAVAIDNARLLDESQATSLQLEALTTLRTRAAWNQKLQEKERVFTYTPLGLRAEKSSADGGNEVTVPITLRGQKIGKISIARKGEPQWNKTDEELLAEVASQVGLAVDNIRLLEEATQRARQEQTIGELASRFSQAFDIDTLLQTAARELGQLPGVEEATVFIGAIR
ncbi:MAG TPA: GAF domain-containing protein, partial [Anaerolineales bacterium]|nr:GAF domain-containing protein [Anaerolineales bacterium]